MTLRLALAGAALVAAGCAGDFPSQPGQAAALAQVWTETFHATVEPPAIEWRSDRCPSGGTQTAVVIDGQCYAGLYLRDDRALVAWRGSFAASAFAHELMHALQWSRGVDDPEHHIAADWALVDDANQLLR